MMRSFDLVANLYDAATESSASSSQWDEAVSDIGRAFHSSGFMIAQGRAEDPGSFDAWTLNYDPRIFDGREFDWADQFDPRYNPGFACILYMPIGRTIDDRLMKSNLTGKARVLRETFESHEMTEVRGFVVSKGTWIGGGFIARSPTSGPIEGRELGRFEEIMHHASRALAIRNRLEGAAPTRAYGDPFRVMATTSSAVASVDAELHLCGHNCAADSLFEQNDAILVQGGRIRLRSGQAHQRLVDILSAIGAGVAPVEPPVIHAPRRFGTVCLRIEVVPLGPMIGTRTRRPIAILRVLDPAAAPRPVPIDRLQAALGLTRAEASVAQLVPMGLSKQQIADRLGISINTVKTHLEHARARVDASGLVELAVMVSRLG